MSNTVLYCEWSALHNVALATKIICAFYVQVVDQTSKVSKQFLHYCKKKMKSNQDMRQSDAVYYSNKSLICTISFHWLKLQELTFQGPISVLISETTCPFKSIHYRGHCPVTSKTNLCQNISGQYEILSWSPTIRSVQPPGVYLPSVVIWYRLQPRPRFEWHTWLNSRPSNKQITLIICSSFNSSTIFGQICPDSEDPHFRKACKLKQSFTHMQGNRCSSTASSSATSFCDAIQIEPLASACIKTLTGDEL